MFLNELVARRQENASSASNDDIEMEALKCRLIRENKMHGPLVVDGFLILRSVKCETKIFMEEYPVKFSRMVRDATSTGKREWIELASTAMGDGRSYRTMDGKPLACHEIQVEIDRLQEASKVPIVFLNHCLFSSSTP